MRVGSVITGALHLKASRTVRFAEPLCRARDPSYPATPRSDPKRLLFRTQLWDLAFSRGGGLAAERGPSGPSSVSRWWGSASAAIVRTCRAWAVASVRLSVRLSAMRESNDAAPRCVGAAASSSSHSARSGGISASPMRSMAASAAPCRRVAIVQSLITAASRAATIHAEVTSRSEPSSRATSRHSSCRRAAARVVVSSEHLDLGEVAKVDGPRVGVPEPSGNLQLAFGSRAGVIGSALLDRRHAQEVEQSGSPAPARRPFEGRLGDRPGGIGVTAVQGENPAELVDPAVEPRWGPDVGGEKLGLVQQGGSPVHEPLVAGEHDDFGEQGDPRRRPRRQPIQQPQALLTTSSGRRATAVDDHHARELLCQFLVVGRDDRDEGAHVVDVPGSLGKQLDVGLLQLRSVRVEEEPGQAQRHIGQFPGLGSWRWANARTCRACGSGSTCCGSLTTSDFDTSDQISSGTSYASRSSAATATRRLQTEPGGEHAEAPNASCSSARAAMAPLDRCVEASLAGADCRIVAVQEAGVPPSLATMSAGASTSQRAAAVRWRAGAIEEAAQLHQRGPQRWVEATGETGAVAEELQRCVIGIERREPPDPLAAQPEWFPTRRHHAEERAPAQHRRRAGQLLR